MFCTDQDGRTVEAWQIPFFGEEAREDVPPWIVARLLDRSFEITDIGGLTDFTDLTNIHSAIPGDHVIRYKDDTVLFCSNTTFDNTYSFS